MKAASSPPGPINDANGTESRNIHAPCTSRRTYLRYLAATLIVYFVLYGSFLFHTGGFPYVFDNNESFSCLWHAYNLYHFPLRDSCGLTDESFSVHPEAHPYVHTHQGNFPRLFSLLLYALHARSVQSHIIITTSTIGTCAIVLGFHLFARRVNALFAFVAMTALMTDYVLFLQWHVNTYRVWHSFFLFSSFLCVDYASQGRRRWVVATVATYFCLFYYEFVFAFFITIGTCVFALMIYWQQKRVFGRMATISATGAFLGASLLFVQLVLYMGLDATLQDIAYTVQARQFTSDANAVNPLLAEFYKSHNIVFWPNFVDGAVMRSPRKLIGYTLDFNFGASSPLVWMPAIMITGGFVLGRLFDGLQRSGVARAVIASSRVHPPGPSRTLGIILHGLLIGVFAIMFARFSITVYRIEQAPIPSEALHTIYTALAMVPPIALFLASTARLRFSTWFDRCVRLFACGALVWFMYVVGIKMLPQFKGLTLGLFEYWFVCPVLLMLNAAAAMLGCFLTIAGRQALPRSSTTPLDGLHGYIIAGVIGYLTVSYLMGGYVLSGYLGRWISFFAFFSNMAYAIPLYLLVQYGRVISIYWRSQGSRLPMGWNAREVARLALASGVSLGMVFLLGLLPGAWVAAQLHHLRFLCPDQFAFLEELGNPTYQGVSLVTNSYAAPGAWMTRHWAFMDNQFKPHNVQLGEGGYLLQRSMADYLWLKDATENSAYERPEFFVATRAQDLRVETMRWQRHRLGARPEMTAMRHEAEKLIGLAEESPLHHELVQFDASGMNQWAICKLDWDFPPYLKYLPDNNGGERVVIVARTGDHGPILHWHYEFAQQDGKSETGTLIRVFVVSRTGARTLLAETSRADYFALNGVPEGNIQVSVTPCTATKRGAEYFSNYLPIGGVPSLQAPYLMCLRADSLHNRIDAELKSTPEITAIRVRYAFGQDHHEPEMNSTVRVYAQDKSGTLVLLKEAAGTNTVEVPPLPVAAYADPDTKLVVSVTPRTRLAAGREYFASQVFAIDNLQKGPTVANWTWPPTPTMRIRQKRDARTTLLTVDRDGFFRWPGESDSGMRLQLSALGQDGSFRVIRELFGQDTFVVENGLYDTVKISMLPLEAGIHDVPANTLMKVR